MLETAAQNINAWNHTRGNVVEGPRDFAAQVSGVGTSLPDNAPETMTTSDGTKRGIISPSSTAAAANTILVDVLHMTGPAMVEDALSRFVFEGLHQDGTRKKGGAPNQERLLGGQRDWKMVKSPDLGRVRREITGEDPRDSTTWDRVTVFAGKSTWEGTMAMTVEVDNASAVEVALRRSGGNSRRESGAAEEPSDPLALVAVLPYCFFRSRGCDHLQRRLNDDVVFHHEFETTWRRSFWHNFYRS